MKKLISPSILSADFANLEKDLRRVESAGADWIHVDVMDGHFVPNLTIGPEVVKALHKVAKLPLDVHLMIEKPEKLLESFIAAGSSIITLHVESSDQIKTCLQKIKSAGKKAGLTLRPGTSLATLEPYLQYLDLILIMTVEPGFGGQGFMMDQVPKIAQARKLIATQSHPIHLEVDGGVNDQTVGHCSQADVLVAGSYIFKNDPAIAIQTLRKLW